MHLAPKKILDDLKKKKVDKLSAVNSLIHLIENVDSAEIRLECIKILQQIGSTHENVFSILENLLISDTNEEIRVLVADILIKKFKEKALSPLKWALDRETSWQFLTKIVSYINEIDNDHAKTVLIDKIISFENYKFIESLSHFFKTKEIQNFTKNMLAKIINNYTISQYFEDILKEVNYKVENGLVVELDLSFACEKTLSWKVLKFLPNFINILDHLKILVLKSNQIGRFPISLRSLYFLKDLDLSYNNLSKLPDDFHSLKSLEFLNLKYNNLTEIPNSIGTLTKLRTLDLNHNKLSTLPPSMRNLTSLEILNLHGNRLNIIPASIKGLSSLKKLKLGLNNLKNVPEWMKNLHSLKKLGLGGNNSLSNFKDWIDFLPPVVELNLYANNIKTLPKSIGTLNSLEILTLPNNQLTTLPESFKKLTSLKKLDLSWNDITLLPEWISSLQLLEELNLRGNKLTMLPRSITQLSSLKVLNITLNKNIIQVPNDLKNKGVQIHI